MSKLKKDNLPHTKPLHTWPSDLADSGRMHFRWSMELLAPYVKLDIPTPQDSFKMVDSDGWEVWPPTTNFFKQLVLTGWDTIKTSIPPYYDEIKAK